MKKSFKGTKEDNQKLFERAKSHWDSNYSDKFRVYKNMYDGTLRRDTVAAWRGNYNVPTAFGIVQQELVRIKKGLLNAPSGNFWGISPRDWSEESQKEADVHGLVLECQRESGHWMPNLHCTVEDGIKLGIGWAKVIWRKEELISEYFDQEEGKVKKRESRSVLMDGNAIERIDNFKVFPDPDARTYWDCKHICEMVSFTRDEIEQEKDKFTDKEEYSKLLSAMKLNKDKDVWEGHYIYKRDNWVLFIEEFQVMDIPNPYEHTMLPLVPYIKTPDPGNIIGKGVIEPIYDLLSYQNKIYNLAADNLVLSVLKVFTHTKDNPLDASSLDLYPGKEVALNKGDEFKVLEMGGLPPSYFNEMKDLQSMFNMATGSLDYLNANMPGQVSATATGATIMVNEGNMRFADSISYNKDNFIIPIVTMLVRNNRQFLKAKELVNHLSKDKIKALNLKDKTITNNFEFKFSAVGDSSLETKPQKLAKLLTLIPIISQISQAEQIPQLGDKINFDLLFQFACEALEVPKEMIKKNVEEPITPEQKIQQDKNNKIQELVQQLAMKLKRPPQEILQDLISGLSPSQIMQKYGAAGTVTAQELSSPNTPAPENMNTNANIVGNSK